MKQKPRICRAQKRRAGQVSAEKQNKYIPQVWKGIRKKYKQGVDPADFTESQTLKDMEIQ